MRVENQQRHIGLLGRERAGDQVMDTLDRHVGGDLPNKAPGIGEAKLDREIAALFHIAQEFRLLEQALNEAAAGFQRFGRFEQG